MLAPASLLVLAYLAWRKRVDGGDTGGGTGVRPGADGMARRVGGHSEAAVGQQRLRLSLDRGHHVDDHLRLLRVLIARELPGRTVEGLQKPFVSGF